MAFNSNNNSNDAPSGNIIDDQSHRRGTHGAGLDERGGQGGLNDRSGLGNDGYARTGGGAGGVNDQAFDNLGSHGHDNLGGRGGHETFGGVGEGNRSGLAGSHGHDTTTHGHANATGKASVGDKIKGTFEELKGKEGQGNHGREGISESPSTMPGAFNANSHPTHGAAHPTTKPSMGEKVMEMFTGKDTHAGQHQDAHTGQHQDVYGGVGENRSGLAATHNTHGHDTHQHNIHGATNTAGHQTMGDKVKQQLSGNDGHSGQHQQHLGGVGGNLSGLAGTHSTHGHDARQDGMHGATNTAGHATIGDKIKQQLSGNDAHSGQHQQHAGGVGGHQLGLAGTHNTHGHDTRQDGMHGATNTAGHATMGDKIKQQLPGNNAHSGQHHQHVGGVSDNRSGLTGAHNSAGHDAALGHGGHGPALGHGGHGPTNTTGKASMVDKVKGTLEELAGKVTGNPIMQHEGEQRKAGELTAGKPAGVGGAGY